MTDNNIIVERIENNVVIASAGVQGPEGPQGPAGPQGPQGDSALYTYVHVQGTPSQLWIINHSLGFYPNVEIVDSAGNSVIGNYEFANVNTIFATFAAPFAGKAYLS